jgi:hypothetical protein
MGFPHIIPAGQLAIGLQIQALRHEAAAGNRNIRWWWDGSGVSRTETSFAFSEHRRLPSVYSNIVTCDRNA